MKSNILSRFRQAAVAFGARHERGVKTTMGLVGFIGDASFALAPIFRNGFVHQLIHGTLNTHLLAAAYGGDKVPFVAAAIGCLSSAAIRYAYPVAQGGFMLNSGVITWNCWKHTEILSGWSMISSIMGGGIGMFTGYLENKFGHNKNWIVRKTVGNPKTVTGSLYLLTNMASIALSGHETGSTIIPNLCWLPHNLGYFILPPQQPASPKGLSALIEPAKLDKA